MYRLVFICAATLLFAQTALSQPVNPRATDWAELRVLDTATGRGVPLVTLETVNGLRYVTDNTGRVAFHEPGLMGREVFFFVKSHGYDLAKDGFGAAGVRVTPKPGTPCEIKIRRVNVAERLCRLTGEGRFRDSVLLGHDIPLSRQAALGGVAGQDTVQAIAYRGKLHWFWGDTLSLRHPLGMLRVAGATSSLPTARDPGLDPTYGIAYDYWVDPKTQFVRPMMPLPARPEGVVWITAVCVVPDADGKECLVGHYTRRKNLRDELEHGLAQFDDTTQTFAVAKQRAATERWRYPRGHPIPWEADGQRWLLFGSPCPNVRVPARLADVLDPTQYEAFTCAKTAKDGKPGDLLLDDQDRPVWRWHKELPPVDSAQEVQWMNQGQLKAEHARFVPAAVGSPAERVQLHSGTVRFNASRKRWVLVAGQVLGKASLLGEVWYAEADAPTGPFTKAVRIVTHDRYSFYNVCHHTFFDRDDGRFLHFEGTYTHEFSGTKEKTPRYDYNQMLYRLDLDAPALNAVR